MAFAVRPALEASSSRVNSAASRERLRRGPKSVVLAHPIPRSSAVAETLHGGMVADAVFPRSIVGANVGVVWVVSGSPQVQTGNQQRSQ